MKKVIIFFALLLTGGVLLAQDAVQRKATAYIKDGVLFYQFAGCTPASELEFYSDPSGGSLLATVRVDNKGTALVQVPAKAKYAFALNRTKVTRKADAGAGYYIVLGAPVMEVKSAEAADGTLRWQVISEAAGIVSEVYSSNEGAPFAKVATLKQTDAAGDAYSYTADAGVGNTVYSIQVTDPAHNLRVTLGRNVVSKENTGAVKVSPSVFTDVVNVQLLSTPVGAVQVYNNVGRLVYSGTVKQGNNALNLAKYAASNYIIRVTDRNNRIVYNGRVVKGQ